MQTMIAALHLAGNKLSMSMGFGSAMAFDPTTANQSAIINSILSLLAITLIFVTDLHHLMLGGVFDSYTLFKVGAPLPVDDFSKYLSLLLAKGFHIGFQLASPFIVFSLILYTGMGLVSKLMPQLHIFFLTLPLQIFLGTSLFAISLSTIMMFFLKYYESELIAFMNPS
jgi:flagellar biosynthetic protein FliR